MAATDPTLDARDKARADIREFLSTRRARVTPEAAGLPSYGGDRRRVAGLRREEVALLAGVSPQYYIRLERGDATGVSESVVDGIARALQLDDVEHTHLLDLIRTASSPQRTLRRRQAAAQRVRPSVQRIVDAMPLMPAMVLNGRLDILTTNTLGRALFAPAFEDPLGPPNTARFVFLHPQARTFFREWGKVADDTVAILRAEAGRDPHDRGMSDLIGQLATRSDEFRIRWAAHDVGIHATGIKLLHHPVVGDLDLPFESLPLAAGSSTSLVVYTPEPDSAAHDALTLLANWAATDSAPDSVPHH
jgi:transcriptional regulator with XRE-family HTH domain